MRPIYSLVLPGLFTMLLAAGACNEEENAGGVCSPGDNIFCRCRSGDSGTKKCEPNGESFGVCESTGGSSCEDSPAASGDTQVRGEEGEDGPPPEPGDLLAGCKDDANCDSGTCRMGICTKPCTEYTDCKPKAEKADLGECVDFPGVSLGSRGICLPYCYEQSSCEAYGGNSLCSYTRDLPTDGGFGYTVCADWPQVTFPPDSYPGELGDSVVCGNDTTCDLGIRDSGRVCGEGGLCADKGSTTIEPTDCVDQRDCADGTTCQPNGSCRNGGDAKACGGQMVVDLHNLGDSKKLTGDTSLYQDIIDQQGTGNCVSAIENESPELIYAVKTHLAGELSVYARPTSSGYDISLYARSSCDDETAAGQLACSDDGGSNASEFLLIDVAAGDLVNVFVDGYNGSQGAFDVTFELTPK